MGFNYFGFMQDKYSTNISTSKASIIKLDGKDVTKNLNINMFDNNDGGFAYALINTAKYLSHKYNALVFVSTDEISLLFCNSKELESIFGTTKTQKISSLFSQDVARFFNTQYKGYSYIYFDAKTFCIPYEKIKSYINYTQKNTYCVSNTYIAKRCLPKSLRHNVSLDTLCNNLENVKINIDRECEYFKSGLIFFKGKKINREKLHSSTQINYQSIIQSLEFDVVEYY